MASALASKATLGDQTSGLFRVSLSFLRYLSTSTTSHNPSTGVKKPKKKNLFDVVQFLPNWGIGYHMAKTHWTDVSYQITKINLYKSGKHGKAWGIAHRDGTPVADAPKKISGVNKRCWRYIPSSKKLGENSPKLEVQSA